MLSLVTAAPGLTSPSALLLIACTLLPTPAPRDICGASELPEDQLRVRCPILRPSPMLSAVMCPRENLDGVLRGTPSRPGLARWRCPPDLYVRATRAPSTSVTTRSSTDPDDVRVLATEHFDIYYSRTDAQAALSVGRLAERWHRRLSRVLEHTLTGRQPLILYGSHRRFEQTNVFSGFIDENTGGFTESRKRRIVIPFAATLAETDHVLGHEIVHAFQYNIAARQKTTLDVPLWFIEGMAEFLTVGPEDQLTAMWMRDAVRSEKLPSIEKLSSPRLFPYRWGAALWAFLADRYGADAPARALRARKGVKRRLYEVTGQTVQTPHRAVARGVAQQVRARRCRQSAHCGARGFQ